MPPPRVAEPTALPRPAIVIVARNQGSSPCPSEMTLVRGRVCVDRWEASLVRVQADGTVVDWTPYEHPPARVAVRAVAARDAVPQAYIDGNLAAEACAAAGKRLCTSDEWQTTCRGPADTTYPYGPDRREGVCNGDGRKAHPVHDATRRYGLNPDRIWHENMQFPKINQMPDTVESSGRHSRCTNAYGAFDMVGNLHEWIDDPEGTFRGGFYMDTRINGEGCSYATTAHGTDYRDYSTGFRCCRDPEALD